MLPVRHARFAFAATLVVAFSLLLVFSPNVGAEQRREQRDGSSEKTPTPVVAEFVVAQPEETPEPEPADDLAVAPSDPDPSPSPSPSPATLVASGGDDGDTAVAVVAGGGDDVTTDLALQGGTVTVHAEFCPLGPNGIDYANSSLAELLDACQEPGSTEFVLDLGWWSGAQTTGDVIADGVFWEPALGPDPISIIGPDEEINSGHGQTNEVFCDVDHDEGAPNHVNFPDTNGVVTTVLSPDHDALDCIWFLTTWVGDAEGGPGTVLVAESGEEEAVFAPAGQTTDLAVASGTITIDARWCPSENNIDYTTVTLPELMDACNEAGYDVAFTLDLGYWAGAQSIGEVIPGGVYWEPPLGPDPIAIYGPAGESFYQKVYCDTNFDGVGKPDYAEFALVGDAIGLVLTTASDDLYCAWFLTPIIAGLETDGGATDVAVATGGGGEIDDLAVEDGAITILTEWCPAGTDSTGLTLDEMYQLCQEPNQDLAFGLDLGYWSGTQAVGEVIADGVHWEPPLGPDHVTVEFPYAIHYGSVCDDASLDAGGVPNYDEFSSGGDEAAYVLMSFLVSPSYPDHDCVFFFGEAPEADCDDAPATRTDPAATDLILPPKPEAHPGHCPDGYSWELLLHEDERGNLTWLYGCVPDGSLDPTGPDDVATGGGRAEHPGHDCPEGYVLKLLLRENKDGSLTWLYGCVPEDNGPTGPIDEAGTGGDSGGSGSGTPGIVPAVDLVATSGGAGGPGCPDGHYWTDGPLEFPNWPVDTDGDGYLDTTDTVVVHGGCVPDGGECPDGSAIHPYYTEEGCIPYGSGPWAT